MEEKNESSQYIEESGEEDGEYQPSIQDEKNSLSTTTLQNEPSRLWIILGIAFALTCIAFAVIFVTTNFTYKFRLLDVGFIYGFAWVLVFLAYPRQQCVCKQ